MQKTTTLRCTCTCIRNSHPLSVHTLTPHTVPPLIVTVTMTELVYQGTNHTLYCTASYDMSLVDTPVTLVFTWTGPGGTAIVSNTITVISSSPSGSTLSLSPVDQPSVSSGNYTYIVTAQFNNTLLQSGSSSDSVRLTVLGEGAEWPMLSGPFPTAAPAPVVVTGVPIRQGRSQKSGEGGAAVPFDPARLKKGVLEPLVCTCLG